MKVFLEIVVSNVVEIIGGNVTDLNDKQAYKVPDSYLDQYSPGLDAYLDPVAFLEFSVGLPPPFVEVGAGEFHPRSGRNRQQTRFYRIPGTA